MLRHYVTLALRTLWRNKFHTAINVTGLAIGTTACLVIYLIVTFELSFNTSLAHYDHIYRLHSKFSGVFSGLNRGAPTGVAPYVKENFAGVEDVSLFFNYPSKVEIPQRTNRVDFDRQEFVVIADPQFFNVFASFTWLAGAPEVLTNPHQVVLTQSQAKKYFGEGTPENWLGREIIYRDSLTTTVAGILQDLSFNTDIAFTDFISTATIEASWIKQNFLLDDWTSTNSSTQIFIRAAETTPTQQLIDQLPQLSKIFDEKNTWEVVNEFSIQPLSDLHFNSETEIFDTSRGPAHLPTLLTMIGIAALLLLIAAINFINLETAQAVRRAKEVGVRKVLGSTRSRLIFQFMAEGLLLTLFALMLALPLTELSLRMFAEFIPKGVTLTLRDFVPFLLLTLFCIGILASAYPAFVLSSYLPALALKNQAHANSSQSRSAFLRKSLIVVQFTFAQVLIIGAVVVGWQMRFMLNKDLGFNKDAVIYFDTPWWEKENRTQELATALHSMPEVMDLSLSDSPPSYPGWSSSTVAYKGKGEPITANAYRKFGDTNYLRFYNIQLITGRNIASSDTVREMLINETLMKELGFASPEEALGELIEYDDHPLPIVGVVKDFHIQSLHSEVKPVMMASELNDFTCLNIRLSTAHQSGEALKNSLKKIEQVWKSFYPDAPFEYHFLDETIRSFYKTEQRTSKLAGVAVGLAILISCLGLFGLASFTAIQRTKEIGIRKVMGASVQQIVMLLSRDFILLVAIAFLLACPLAWVAAHRWLEGFIYRIEPLWWMFGCTALLAMAIAFATVSYQTFTAARKNPVDSLRSE